jgi:hypothetical protein
MSDWQDDVRVYDVLDTEVEEGEYRLTLGHASAAQGIYSRGIPWSQTGLVCIPDPPTAEGNCMAVTVSDGVEAQVWFTRDNRYASKIGTLTAGARGFVTRGEARFLLNPEREQITQYTLTSDGKVMMSDLDGSAGVITIMVDDLIVQIDKSTQSVKLMAGKSSSIEVKKDGINILTGTVNIMGGVDLGGDGTKLGQPVALATLVLAELQKLSAAFNSHTHAAGLLLDTTLGAVTGTTAAPSASYAATAVASSTVSAAL